jgi:Superinfection immunity protein
MRFLILSGLLYFVPTLLGRHKADVMGIFLVNLLLGWTIIGWIVALVWALSPDRHVPVGAVPVSSGRFCSQCGTLSPAGAHFCATCGRAV